MKLISSLLVLFSIFMPLEVLGIGGLIGFIVSFLIYLAYTFLPLIAPLLHLVLWLVSISAALQTSGTIFAMYIGAAAIYILFGLIPFIMSISSQKK